MYENFLTEFKKVRDDNNKTIDKILKGIHHLGFNMDALQIVHDFITCNV